MEDKFFKRKTELNDDDFQNKKLKINITNVEKEIKEIIQKEISDFIQNKIILQIKIEIKKYLKKKFKYIIEKEVRDLIKKEAKIEIKRHFRKAIKKNEKVEEDNMDEDVEFGSADDSYGGMDEIENLKIENTGEEDIEYIKNFKVEDFKIKNNCKSLKKDKIVNNDRNKSFSERKTNIKFEIKTANMLDRKENSNQNQIEKSKCISEGKNNENDEPFNYKLYNELIEKINLDNKHNKNGKYNYILPKYYPNKSCNSEMEVDKINNYQLERNEIN